MSHDLHYNQAYIFFEDAKYSRALEEMARSETIDDESFKKFAAQCNAMIAQQYIITIKQLISDGDYNEAQRLKREYQDNYQQNEAIDAIDVPSPKPKPKPKPATTTTTAYTAPIRKLSNLINSNANKDDSDTSNKKIGLIAGAVGIIILLLIIISTCSSSRSDSYDSSSSNSEQTCEDYYQESYESEAAEEVEQPVYYDTYDSEPSYNNDYSSDSYNDNSADVWE